MEELKELLGVEVDLVTTGEVPASARDRIFSEAREI